MNICKNVEELIGRTPLMELCNIEKAHGCSCRVLAKLERFNPAGSAKDRVAMQMLADLEASGQLSKDTVIIEPTSGNTGIGLAMLCAAKGYRAIIVMPDTMSKERQLLMTAYGAELVLSDGSLGMSGAIAKADEIKASIPGSIIAGQFVNPSNPKAHYLSTGPEIWNDTDGEVDCFIAGIGTGGTISGTGKYLKEKNPGIKIIGFEPASSAFFTKGETGKHGLQGIGANFKPDILDLDVIDEILTISEEEAYAMGRELGREEGLLVGITSGAAVAAALKFDARLKSEAPDPAGSDHRTIVVLLPDTGERYLSTDMFKD